MINIHVIDREGGERKLTGDSGRSVMEVLRDGSCDELLALCGGCCSCATCHVFVDSAFLDKFPPLSSDENDLLDSSEHRQANSRLACQLLLAADLDELRVTIAPED